MPLTKAEQTLRTRRAILDRARQLFATQGYAKTGTEEIIRELGITRGALYHQFKDKRDVFQAVVSQVFDDMTFHITRATLPYDDAWQRLLVGCQAFLEIAQHEEFRRLIFIEAPAVLEPATLAELDQAGLGLLHQGIRAVADAGALDTIDPEGFAHLVNGALNELAIWVSGDPERLRTAQALVASLLERHHTPLG